jgi:outer membrane protein TolC
MAIHTWQAAQHTYNATLQSFENSFRTLYYQVQDYKQVLDAAKTALSVEQHNYQVDQLKYDQGTISQNTLLEAKDDLSAAQDKVTSAAIDLFSAYNNYRWAVDYGILN